MAWSVIQSAVSGFGSPPGTLSYGSNVSSGTKLIAVTDAVFGPGNTISTVKDGAGNAMTLLATEISGNTNQAVTQLWAMDTPAGDVGTKPAITFTQSGGSGGFLGFLWEVSGLATGNTTAMLDGTAGLNNGVEGSSAASGSYSSTAANEFLVALYGTTGSSPTGVWTVPSGYTADSNSINSNATFELGVAYKNSSNGAETATWALTGGTAGTNPEWATILVAFKLAGAANPAGTVQPWTTVAVPRRKPRRVLWEGGAGQAFVAVPAPVQEFRLAPRRKLARALWHGGSGQAYVAVPAPLQEFRLAPRRKLARAVVEFTPVVTTNAAAVFGPAGTVPVLMANQTRLIVRRDGRVVRH